MIGVMLSISYLTVMKPVPRLWLPPKRRLIVQRFPGSESIGSRRISYSQAPVLTKALFQKSPVSCKNPQSGITRRFDLYYIHESKKGRS